MLEEIGPPKCTVKTLTNIWKLLIYSSQNETLDLSKRTQRSLPPLGFHLPNIHTSLAEVNRRKLIDSGAIHLMGNFPLEAL